METDRLIPSASLGPSSEVKERRNWLPLLVAAALVLAAVGAVLLMGIHGKRADDSASGAPDPYAANLRITNLAMSESSNLAGGKVTYLDGHIANVGDRTVTGVVVLATFLDYAKKVAQSDTLPLTPIRMREPYIDTEPMSAAPLKPGAEEDFRLIFDTVSQDWAGEVPELHIVRVNSK